ncbi:MAG: cytochrome c3 family protein [Chthoniobacterales bacterium]|nr:cytochrome c3 family protein [Chthoniobacterales bacterium]
MAQIFSRSANVHARVILFGLIILLAGAGWTMSAIFWSPYTTYVDVPLSQPVPFSHKHHVGDDGIDCRYCHTSVEKSAFAGIPSTQICMTCHSQLWTEASLLAPVRNSLTTNRPLQWNRVNDLPDFAYFNHSIHISKGVGCSTCHGELDKMPLTWRTQTLYMKWCLECHRAPESYVRPHSEIYDLHWTPPPDQKKQGLILVRQNQIDTTGRLTNCSTCHR